MLEISRVILTKAAALVDIPRILSQVYEYNLETSSVAETLEVYLDVFKDNIFIYIEYPYVDKFYRNSYYTYFASKHHLYPRDCIRLSFFDKEISDTDFRSIETTASLQESFFGFEANVSGYHW